MLEIAADELEARPEDMDTDGQGFVFVKGSPDRKIHLVNLALHVANVLLLFDVLRRMTGAWGRSAMVAALFALHPMHVDVSMSLVTTSSASFTGSPATAETSLRVPSRARSTSVTSSGEARPRSASQAWRSATWPRRRRVIPFDSAASARKNGMLR